MKNVLCAVAAMILSGCVADGGDLNEEWDDNPLAEVEEAVSSSVLVERAARCTTTLFGVCLQTEVLDSAFASVTTSNARDIAFVVDPPDGGTARNLFLIFGGQQPPAIGVGGSVSLLSDGFRSGVTGQLHNWKLGGLRGNEPLVSAYRDLDAGSPWLTAHTSPDARMPVDSTLFMAVLDTRFDFTTERSEKEKILAAFADMIKREAGGSLSQVENVVILGASRGGSFSLQMMKKLLAPGWLNTSTVKVYAALLDPVVAPWDLLEEDNASELDTIPFGAEMDNPVSANTGDWVLPVNLDQYFTTEQKQRVYVRAYVQGAPVALVAHAMWDQDRYISGRQWLDFTFTNTRGGTYDGEYIDTDTEAHWGVAYQNRNEAMSLRDHALSSISGR